MGCDVNSVRSERSGQYTRSTAVIYICVCKTVCRYRTVAWGYWSWRIVMATFCVDPDLRSARVTIRTDTSLTPHTPR
eukprot:7129998-Prymnesium_polylepis.2